MVMSAPAPPRVKRGPIVKTVKLIQTPSGANDLYQYLQTQTGKMDFRTLSQSGHDTASLWFTCQLIINIPNKPLSISFVAMDKGSKKDLKNSMCGSILPQLKQWIADQTMCGDVEANPGPFIKEHNLVWKTQTYSIRKTVRRHKKQSNNLNYIRESYITTTPPVSEDITYPEKFDRHKYFRQQFDEKNKRLERDYRSKHAKFSKSPYTGNIKDDLMQFWDYLDKHGYASNQAHKLTPIFVQKVFEKWARSDKLITTDVAHKIFIKQKGVFALGTEIRPHYRARKLLIRAFVAENRSPECYRYLRIILAKSYQIASNTSLTLKDIIRHRDRCKRKGINIDASLAMPQMHSSYDVIKTKEEEGWVGGTIRSMGRKIGEGITDVVVPVLNKVGSAVVSTLTNIPLLKNIKLVLTIVGFCLMVAILGWAIVTVAKAITMGINSFIIPGEHPGASEDMSTVTVQHFSVGTAKMVATSWLESIDGGIQKFNAAFTDTEILKSVKKLGDFSAAVKNCEYLLTKIKNIFVWCVNRTCSFICGRPFFEDAQHVQLLQHKIQELMSIVNIADVSSMTDPMKESFVKAYMDLVEMYPFVFRVDTALGASINATLVRCQQLYKSCQFYLKTNVTRMEPYYIALEGKAGQGKTYLLGHLTKMIYDAIRVQSPTTWKALFYNGQEVAHEYSDTLVYDRKNEQEYWDGYNNQPICKMDDIGQTLIPEDRASQFFSIIRMVNNDPYPLHMADIIRKDSTVFKSFLLLTSTNMNENLFKLPGELGIVEPSAYLRRRDVSIKVSRIKGHVKEGTQSVQYLEKYILKVYFPDKQTGELGEELKIDGYEPLCRLVNEIATEIISRHHSFTTKVPLDHTGKFATYNTREATRIDLEKDMRTLREKTTRNQNIDGVEEDHSVTLNTTANSMTTHTYEDMSNILGSFESMLKSKNDFTLPTHRPATKEEQAKMLEDLSEAKQQMYLAFNPEIFNVPKFYRNVVYGVHPSTQLFLKQGYQKNVNTYDEAQIAIQELAKVHTFFDTDPGWKHQYIVEGYAWQTHLSYKEGRLKSVWKYDMSFYEYPVYSNPELRKAVVKKWPLCPPHDVDIYIGLSNWIYYNISHKEYSEFVFQHSGHNVIYYDDVYDQVENNTFKEWWNYKDLILWETKHEKELRASKSESTMWLVSRAFVMMLAAFVGLSLVVTSALYLYRKLDPGRPVDMEFVEPQSSDPRLNKTQRDIARARALPKVNMIQARKQFADDNARALLPILRRNTYVIRGQKEGKEYAGYAVGIENSTFVVAAHMIEAGCDIYYLSESDGTREMIFPKTAIKYQYVRPKNGHSTTDLALVYFPMTNYVRSITHLLFKEDDILDLAQGIVREDVIETEEDGKTVISYREIASPDAIQLVRSDNYCGTKTVEGLAKFRLNAPSIAGDCVRGYIMFNPALTRKLGFFHIAMLKDHVLAGRLNQEDVAHFNNFLKENLSEVEKQVKKFKIITEPMILAQHQHKIKFDYVPDERIYGFSVLGKLNVNFPSPGKSQIIPTPMCKTFTGVVNGELVVKEPPFPVETAPAILRKKDGKDPMDIGFQSCKNRKIIYGKFIQEHHYDGIFNNAIRHCTARLLPLWEVLKGLRNHPYAHSVKRSTSMAFYHKMFAKLKREYVDLNDDEHALRKDKESFIHVGKNVYLHRDVLEIVIKWIKAFNKDEVSLNWVIAMLKDEIRPLDRVEACKTRIFYAGNFAFMIISRMVFGEFFTELEANWHYTDIAVGCNPYSADWKWIFMKIIELGMKVKDDDTVKWDQNFPTTEFIFSFCPTYVKHFNLQGKMVELDLITEKIMVNHEDLVYAVTISNFHCAVVVGNNVLFMILQASGADSTTMFNCIANSAENRCLVEHVSGKPFKEVARIWVYGDDLLLNCPSVSRSDLWKWAKIMFNHERTDPGKNPAAEDTPISMAFFLQRGFVHQSGIIACPLNLKSINGMLQWIDKPKDKTVDEQFAINCKTALVETVRHGSEVFTHYKREINFYLGQLGPSWTIKLSYTDAVIEMVMRATLNF